MSNKLNKSWFTDSDFDFKIPSAPCATKKAKGSFTGKITNGSNTSSSLHKLWSEKHKPERVNELVVQKKKIVELQQWIDDALKPKSYGPPILILNGPSGCGKTCTFHLICKEKSICISQWEEPIRYSSSVEWEYSHDLDVDSFDQLRDLNPLNHFKDFLFRSSRYGSLAFNDDGGKSFKDRKVIVVKEIPNMAKNNTEEWFEILRQYKRRGSAPLVFIMTEETGSSSARMLFPAYLIEELSIFTLSFNSLASTFMIKALQRVLELERKGLPDDCSLPSIAESSGGDLRNALNTLQLLLIPRSQSQKPRSLKRKKNEEKSETTANSKDPSLNLLHALGKVLYRKRTTDCDPSQELPLHLTEEARLPLQENPDDLADKMKESGSKVSLFLHQNYLHFYNRLEDASRAANYLDLSDCFSREFLEDYSLLISIRGIMHCNTDVVSGKWRPIHKPAWNAAFQAQQKFQANSRRFWPMLSSYPTEFYTNYLPFLSRIYRERDLSKDKEEFLKTVNVFGKWKQLDRSVNEEEEIFDEINIVTVEDVNTAIPVLEEDEEIIIEEFDD